MSYDVAALRFPVETWELILYYLPHDSRRPCLFVSRFVHSIVLHTLFAVVTVRFGAWETLHATFNDTGQSNAKLCDKANARSLEMMTHITRDSNFAFVVRDMRVHSFADNDISGLREPLADALRALPRLRSFHWYGSFPSLHPLIASTLADHCPNLQELRMPVPRSKDPKITALHGLRCLKTFAVMSIGNLDNIGGYWPHDVLAILPTISTVMEASAATLRSLSVPSALLMEIPHGVLSRLEVLEFWGPWDVDHLIPFFAHAARLQSFSLVETTHDSVYQALTNTPGGLMQLTALKLMSLDAFHDARCLDALAAFIKERPALRWLDINLPGSERHGVLGILDAITTCPRLEVLGLDMRTMVGCKDIGIVADLLPTTLVALHLQSCWDNVPLDYEQFASLLDRLSLMPALTVLHLQSAFTAEMSVAEDLATQLPGLELIGLGDYFWIIHGPPEWKVATPMHKREVVMRSAHALRSKEGDWLMRFHGLAEGLFGSAA